MRWPSTIITVAISASMLLAATLSAQDKPEAQQPAVVQQQDGKETTFGKELDKAELMIERPVGQGESRAARGVKTVPGSTARPNGGARNALGQNRGSGTRATIGANRGRRINVGNTKGQGGLASIPKTEIKVRLPEDNSKPVLVMDATGGYRALSPAGFEPTPLLQIFADGRVLTGRKSELVNEVEGKIDLVNLQSLLVYISDDCRFFDITSEMLKSDLEAKRIARTLDAATTQFEVNIKDHSNRVEVYALPHAAGKFSDVPSVASMVAIASRCRRIIAMTRLGTNDEADAVLDAVNKSLAAQVPAAPEFTFENLQFAEQFTDGRRTATWVQNYEEDGKPMLAYATYQVDTNGDDSVSLNVAAQNPAFNQRGR